MNITYKKELKTIETNTIPILSYDFNDLKIFKSKIKEYKKKNQYSALKKIFEKLLFLIPIFCWTSLNVIEGISRTNLFVFDVLYFVFFYLMRHFK